jgi:hypothetical protein
MARCWLVACAVLMSGLLAGCRCCPLTTSYANVIDDVSDTHVYFDNWYCPRWDISRAGKPDWVGTDGRRLRHNCCSEGEWDRYDDCNLYPPSYPYEFSGHAMPDPFVRHVPSSPAQPPTPPTRTPPLPVPIE